ncbi:hypothetical protein [Lysobacter humi (ex Lee et al. 2017)]
MQSFGQTQLHVVDVDNGVRLRSSIEAHAGAVRRVRFDGEHGLLSCGEDGRVHRWDLRQGSSTLISSHDNFASDVLPLGAGRWLSCGYDGRIRRAALSCGSHSRPGTSDRLSA